MNNLKIYWRIPDRHLLLVFSFTLTHVILISCQGDESIPKKICLPESLIAQGNNIFFEYDSNGKLTTVNYRMASFTNRKITLSYDSKGRLQSAVDKSISINGDETLREYYELIYVEGTNPSELIISNSNPDFKITKKYTFDSHGRLTGWDRKFGALVSKTRYEYDQDNVSRVYYTSPASTEEVLGRENLTFDIKSTFYSNSKELEAFNLYINDYEPSKNNKLKSLVYYQNPGIKNYTPVTETFSLLYNDDGLPTSQLSDYLSSTDFTYVNMKYICR